VKYRTHATHIHPGYGFLSESSEFALACQEAGIIFIGPSVETLCIASDKMKSRELAISLGIKVAPGYRVSSPEDVIRLGKSMGYPIMIKALDGGGGRGIRIVDGPGQAEDAFKR
jgi:pyruvate carboxylase